MTTDDRASRGAKISAAARARALRVTRSTTYTHRYINIDAASFVARYARYVDIDWPLARATSRERNQSTREPNNACDHMAKQLSNKTEAT